MSPYLEKALSRYYVRRRRKMWTVILAAAALFAATCVWFVIARPEEGLWSLVVAAVGMPSAFGVIVGFGWLLFGDRGRLLQLFRERPSEVRSVRRGETRYRYKVRNIDVEKDVSTLFVELADSRSLPLFFDGNLDEFNRLQRLLEKELAR